MSSAQEGILELFGEAVMRADVGSVTAIGESVFFPLQIGARWSENQARVSCCEPNIDATCVTTGCCMDI